MDNYEFLNSSPETQFELMNTMLQLEQLARSPTVQPSFNQQMQSFTYQNQYFGTSQTAMREMIYHIAAMQPVNIDLETAKPPKRRNVKISKEPQSVAARLRREKISERIRILQKLVPGGSKMDTASMLDEAINYVKFLKSQVQNLERVRDVQSQMEGASMLGFGSDASVYPCYANQDEQFMPY